MINKLMKLKNNKKGFTLIELIVVIAILAILAAILIPRLAGFTDQATQAQKEATAQIVYKAYQAFEAANKGKDPAATDLAKLVEGYDGTKLSAVSPAGDTTYITTLTYDGVKVGS